MNKLKPWAKYLFLFYMGGSIYYYIEVLFRGYSYLSMFILGGICFIYCGLQNERTSWDYPFWKQLAKSEAFVLIAEFLTGCVLNLWLGLGIWDYSIVGTKKAIMTALLLFTLHGLMQVFL